MKRVKWLRPVVVNNILICWPDQCEAEVTTPQTVSWREAHGTGTACKTHAKIDYRGSKLCLAHAKIRALEELAGPPPVEQINAAE